MGIRGPAKSKIPNANGTYGATADELCVRIFALIPDHPEVLEMKNCWDLFEIGDFNCKDLEPSYMQAACALAKAKGLHKAGKTPQDVQHASHF